MNPLEIIKNQHEINENKLSKTREEFVSKLEEKFSCKRPFEDILEDKLDTFSEIFLSFLQNSMVGIVYALEAKDAYSSRHSQRVAIMCSRFAGILELKHSQQKAIELAASIHDIGKIGIPDAVLLCPCRLSEEEFAIMKKHPVIGAEIVSKTLDAQQENVASTGVKIPSILVNLIDSIQEGILHHHERWDGKGYPGNLKAEEIPYISRVIALADSTDAMLSSRVYRKALSEDFVKEEIRKNAGVMYDPELAVKFLENWDKIVGDLYKVTDVQTPNILDTK